MGKWQEGLPLLLSVLFQKRFYLHLPSLSVSDREAKVETDTQKCVYVIKNEGQKQRAREREERRRNVRKQKKTSEEEEKAMLSVAGY